MTWHWIYFITLFAIILHTLMYYDIYSNKKYFSMLYEHIKNYPMDQFMSSLFDLSISLMMGAIFFTPLYSKLELHLYKHAIISLIFSDILWHMILKTHPLMDYDMKYGNRWYHKLINKIF